LSQTITRKFNELLSQRTTNHSRSAYNCHNGQLIRYTLNQSNLDIYELNRMTCQQIQLPFTVRRVTPFGDQWLLTDYVPSSSSSSYLLTLTDEHKPIVRRFEFDIDRIGLGTSGGKYDHRSLWFATAEDYLVNLLGTTTNSLNVERFKRTKVLSCGDVPIQEMYEKRRLQTFVNREHSFIVSFYAKNEIDAKLQ
jgi:hypothetical protein